MDLLNSIRTLLKGQKLHSPIDPTETIVFFPTVACRSNHDTWRIPIHGWIYQPTELSRLRRLGLHLVKRALRIPVKRTDPQMPIFRQRMGALLADNNRGQRIQVKIAGAAFTLKKSRANGHFHGTLELPNSQIASTLAPDPRSNATHWLNFRAITESNDTRNFEGRVLLLPDRGLSVISDIDDTIKISEVLDRRRLLTNTFLNAFATVPGMPDLYQHWQSTRHAAFHYVSATPWHLYPCLAEFLHAQGFPAGTFHMRTFRLAGRDLATAFRSPRRVKSLHIKNLLACHPHRRFLLVGDSGESDPEMYAHFAQQRPAQIEKIYIRNITHEPRESPRWQKTFARLPKQKWQLFSTPAELQ